MHIIYPADVDLSFTLEYKRDEKYQENKLFLNEVTADNQITTSVFNILEVCGILSFNLNEQQLIDLYNHFPRRCNLQGLSPVKQADLLPSFRLSAIMAVMSQKASFGDVLIICAVLEIMHRIDFFVSWNASHFKGKMSKPALTPAEYLRQDL